MSEDKMVQATSEPGASDVRSPFQFGTWHPIETAPKEGRFLVGWWGDYGGGEREFVWFVADGPLGYGGCWKHWYPVPPPPIEEKGE